jgi:SAM-dependent methyltransferase
VSSDSERPGIAHRSDCRVCGRTELERILSLGPSPLANAFLESAGDFAGEAFFPLDLYFCDGCSLLQLLDVVNPEVMFRRYLYVTGTSTTVADHNRRYADTLCDLLDLTATDLVVDIASNNGSFLQCFRARGVRTLGIEPAVNLAARASAAGIETVNDFFSGALAETLRSSRPAARLVAANNVLAHVDDPRDFLAGCRRLVADDGLVTIEVPYVRDLLDRVEYDTIYHEHLSYFSVTSLLRLCERAGLAAVRVDRVDVHGGSLRMYLSRSAVSHAPEIRDLESEERDAGVAAVERYRQFARDVERHRTDLRALLRQLSGNGSRVVGYGAPAKGNTLLNYCGIDSTLLPYTVDKNPLKVGLFTPGTHIPVRDVSALSDQNLLPEYVLILAWNFAEEIMAQQAAHRARGGKFIIPIPEPQVV